MTPGAATRATAAELIAAVRFDGRSLKAALPPALDSLTDARDRALCEAMAFEATRWLPRYEFWLDRLLQKPLASKARTVHALLLAGLAQLHAMQMPPHAVISATAEAARSLRQPHLVGLVNAVLRRFARERDALDARAQADPEAASAHPRWLLERLQHDWPEQVESIVAQNLVQAPLWLRVNTRQISVDDWREQLHHLDIAARAHALAPAALCPAQGVAPTRLPGWNQGQISVQDVSAQLPVPLLMAQAGDRVLDIGAAPGGKTAQICEVFGPDVRVTALERDPARAARITSTLSRLNLQADCVIGDGTEPERWWDGHPFDRILLDAPCSATGIIRRQPDIKWHRRAQDIPVLVALQARLLDAAWSMLRPGGRLVYATCSVLRDENDRQIDAFLARTPSARASTAPSGLGQFVGAGVQRFAEREDGDGFFFALLDKPAADRASEWLPTRP
ncbi:MAG TPA: 16S rRNA (cytosine(967)-C(5))-methyltransferase RsmB [Chiayiivirga sp.]|nr:16S rRNA (cytosine(967)-C(5))-methyltransferase RsmB [Chiayiivirga sp.]